MTGSRSKQRERMLIDLKSTTVCTHTLLRSVYIQSNSRVEEKSNDMDISRNISASTGANSIIEIALPHFPDTRVELIDMKGCGSWSSTNSSVLAKHVNHSSRRRITDPLQNLNEKSKCGGNRQEKKLGR